MSVSERSAQEDRAKHPVQTAAPKLRQARRAQVAEPSNGLGGCGGGGGGGVKRRRVWAGQGI